MNGSTKFAVPICTAVAPATMNSRASRASMMPPMPMHGDLHGIVAFVDHPHGDRSDGRSAQPADAVRNLRPACLDVDHHREKRVDERHGVGARVLGRPGERGDVGDVRRELRDERQPGHFANGAHDVERAVEAAPELDAALP